MIIQLIKFTNESNGSENRQLSIWNKDKIILGQQLQFFPNKVYETVFEIQSSDKSYFKA